MNPEVTQALNKYSRGEELTREELHAIALEMPDMVECITNIAATVAAWLEEALPRWASIIADIADCVRIASDTQTAINTCTNRRVAHLARYGRTRRIRVKNIRRALKIVKEERQ